MTDTSNTSGGVPIALDLSLSHFDGVAVSLIDLHRYGMAQGQAMISGKTFTNCRIEGPAVMAVVQGNNFDNTDFGYANGDIRNLVLLPASPNGVIGAIPVSDCVFRNCVFFAVGFTGPKAFTDQILSLETRP